VAKEQGEVAIPIRVGNGSAAAVLVNLLQELMPEDEIVPVASASP
jgi:hypothetical protein